MINKTVLIVMDSVGVGELPDSAQYGDEGSHTLKNIILNNGGLNIPNLVSLGIGNIQGIDLPYKTDNPLGCFGKSDEKSAGKDTTSGHWEISGIILDKPFPVYPKGFPPEIIEEFKRTIDNDILWNKPASGTEIIEKLGFKHMETGFPIVYTSADSVFQIAGHEDIIPVEKLYEMCRQARQILQGKHAVGRVIARPFTGKPGHFVRTNRRKDFSLEPIGTTILDLISSRGMEVAAVGKIKDIFNGRGITRSVHTHDNTEGIEATIDFINEDFSGLIFTNLVDFDMIYGHRNDVGGYAKALESFDKSIPRILSSLKPHDILILTSDHGCDPTTPSTDHSREYIPILVYGSKIAKGIDIGIRKTFCDIGCTILDFFGITHNLPGESFKSLIV